MSQPLRLFSRCVQTAARPTYLPPAFLLPSLSAQQVASFSNTSTRSARKNGNKNRGVSAIRRTGPRKAQTLSVDVANLPKPVRKTNDYSGVEVDPNHGLWDFFDRDRNPFPTIESQNAHGRGWTVMELRNKDFSDLHKLWWVCVKERNRIATGEVERIRVKAGYGDYEAEARDREVQQTMRGIKHVLTERWYAWQDARTIAETDPEVNLDPQAGEYAYNPVEEEIDAFEELDETELAALEKQSAVQQPQEGQAQLSQTPQNDARPEVRT